MATFALCSNQPPFSCAHLCDSATDFVTRHCTVSVLPVSECSHTDPRMELCQARLLAAGTIVVPSALCSNHLPPKSMHLCHSATDLITGQRAHSVFRYNQCLHPHRPVHAAVGSPATAASGRFLSSSGNASYGGDLCLSTLRRMIVTYVKCLVIFLPPPQLRYLRCWKHRQRRRYRPPPLWLQWLSALGACTMWRRRPCLCERNRSSYRPGYWDIPATDCFCKRGGQVRLPQLLL